MVTVKPAVPQGVLAPRGAWRPCATGSASGPTALQALKARLFQTVSRANAADGAAAEDLRELSDVLQGLIAANPSPDTATSPLINGRWVLLYTSRVADLPGFTQAWRQPLAGAATQQARPQAPPPAGGPLEAALSPLQLASDTAYKFFYRFVPVLAGSAVGARRGAGAGPAALVTPRGNFQVFDTARQLVDNQARFDVGGRPCGIDVRGVAQVVPQAGPGAPQQRLKATFQSFTFIAEGQARLELPLTWLNPTGFVDTPYLDDGLRISIGDKGSVFIAVRQQQHQQ